MGNFKTNILPLVARFLLSLLFFYSGLGKLISPSSTITYISAAGLPLPTLAYAGAVLVELVVATALLVGYRTALAAGVLAIYTLVTALAFHTNFAERMQVISFLKNIAICGGLLQVIASSAGAFSLDRALSERKMKV